MSKRKLQTFGAHLAELTQNPVFAPGYEEEHRRSGLAIMIAELRAKMGCHRWNLPSGAELSSSNYQN